MDKEKNKQTLVSAIIPAYNEEKTIGAVVKTALAHKNISEVIVIDDGSSDNTAGAALDAGAKLLQNRENTGKAQSMLRGVKAAENGIICFLDADILGLNSEILDKIINPVIAGSYDMYVAIRSRKLNTLNKLLRFFPILGGERAIKKEVWELVPPKYEKNFQIEIALNFFVKKNGKKMGHELMPGLTQVVKEKKYGLPKGFIERIFMMYDIMAISLRLYVVLRIKELFTLDAGYIYDLSKKK